MQRVAKFRCGERGTLTLPWPHLFSLHWSATLPMSTRLHRAKSSPRELSLAPGAYPKEQISALPNCGGNILLRFQDVFSPVLLVVVLLQVGRSHSRVPGAAGQRRIKSRLVRVRIFLRRCRPPPACGFHQAWDHTLTRFFLALFPSLSAPSWNQKWRNPSRSLMWPSVLRRIVLGNGTHPRF